MEPLFLQQNPEKLHGLVTDAINKTCCINVDFSHALHVEGLLAITVDDEKVILVNVKEVIRDPKKKKCDSQPPKETEKSEPYHEEFYLPEKICDDEHEIDDVKDLNPFHVKPGIVSRALVPMHSFRSPFKRQRGRRRFAPSTDPGRLKRSHAEMENGFIDKPNDLSDEENVIQNSDKIAPCSTKVKPLGDRGMVVQTGEDNVVKSPPNAIPLMVKKEVESCVWHQPTMSDPAQCGSEPLMRTTDHPHIHTTPCSKGCSAFTQPESNNNNSQCCPPPNFAHVLTSTPTEQNTPTNPCHIQEEALNLVKEKKVHFEDELHDQDTPTDDLSPSFGTTKCHLCGQVMSSRRNLEYHLQRHQGIYQYKCQHCGRGFSSSTNLKGHLWKHTNVKDFRCPQCGAEFIYKINLKRHMQKKHPESLVVSPARLS